MGRTPVRPTRFRRYTLRTGLPGNPGLLARGGALGGGLPLIRPDLHFFYNLIETTPMLIGFVHQCRRAGYR